MCSLGITFLLFVQNCRKLILRKTILVSSKMMSISINLISTINPSNETTPIIWYSTASVYGCVSVCVCVKLYIRFAMFDSQSVNLSHCAWLPPPLTRSLDHSFARFLSSFFIHQRKKGKRSRDAKSRFSAHISLVYIECVRDREIFNMVILCFYRSKLMFTPPSKAQTKLITFAPNML